MRRRADPVHVVVAFLLLTQIRLGAQELRLIWELPKANPGVDATRIAGWHNGDDGFVVYEGDSIFGVSLLQPEKYKSLIRKENFLVLVADYDAASDRIAYLYGNLDASVPAIYEVGSKTRTRVDDIMRGEGGDTAYRVFRGLWWIDSENLLYTVYHPTAYVIELKRYSLRTKQAELLKSGRELEVRHFNRQAGVLIYTIGPDGPPVLYELGTQAEKRLPLGPYRAYIVVEADKILAFTGDRVVGGVDFVYRGEVIGTDVANHIVSPLYYEPTQRHLVATHRPNPLLQEFPEAIYGVHFPTDPK